MLAAEFIAGRYDDIVPEDLMSLMSRRLKNSNRMVKLAYLRQY
jgi:hypothetical protein